uniref:Uncharacterized protein n=1 Tax=Rhizoctonia cerealis phyllomonavirus TaxID=3068671 RepID=A0AA51BSF7_9MONO|nr:MAG: hypothetical protein [Rhizoctonia cerealis phyllomonavirus]
MAAQITNLADAYNLFNKQATKAPAVARSGLPKEGLHVRYYRVVGTEKKHFTARAVLAGTILYEDISGMPGGTLSTWIWTLMELIAPGSVSAILVDPEIILEAIDFTNDQIRFFFDQYPDGTAPDPADPVPDIGGLNLQVRPDTHVFTGVISGLIYGLYIFAIAKTPTAENLTAFTDRRPSAVINKAGLPDGTNLVLRPLMPGVAQLKAFSGYFNMRARVRESLTREVIRWVGASPTLGAEAVATHVKLWKNVGLTHLFMVRNFVRQYGAAIRHLTPLQHQVETAAQTWEQYAQSTDEFKEYSRVIHGDREHFGNSRDYFDLMILARDVLRRTDVKFANYAANTTESPYFSKFLTLCTDEDLFVPEARA